MVFLALMASLVLHEAGHYWAARATGMKATEFFVGFGPRLWSVSRGETEFGIRAVPLGGYVRIAGMNPLEDPADGGYAEKKFWQKSLVVLIGVAIHFALGYLVFAGVFWVDGIDYLGTRIERVEPSSPALAASRPETGSWPSTERPCTAGGTWWHTSGSDPVSG